MRLVDENEIDVRPFPPGDGLDRAHLHRLVAIGARVDALQHADGGDALGFEGRDRLVDQADSAGTVKATRLPLSRARWMMWAAVSVLPKPVGACSIGRRFPEPRRDGAAFERPVPDEARGGGGRSYGRLRAEFAENEAGFLERDDGLARADGELFDVAGFGGERSPSGESRGRSKRVGDVIQPMSIKRVDNLAGSGGGFSSEILGSLMRRVLSLAAEPRGGRTSLALDRRPYRRNALKPPSHRVGVLLSGVGGAGAAWRARSRPAGRNKSAKSLEGSNSRKVGHYR